MAASLGGQIITSSLQSYADACSATKKLAVDVFWAAKTVRQECGALGAATAQKLSKLFPGIDIALLEQLSAPFERK